jgi:hypothetical protein
MGWVSSFPSIMALLKAVLGLILSLAKIPWSNQFHLIGALYLSYTWFSNFVNSAASSPHKILLYSSSAN